jgi:hypothetical protein
MTTNLQYNIQHNRQYNKLDNNQYSNITYNTTNGMGKKKNNKQTHMLEAGQAGGG